MEKKILITKKDPSLSTADSEGSKTKGKPMFSLISNYNSKISATNPKPVIHIPPETKKYFLFVHFIELCPNKQ